MTEALPASAFLRQQVLIQAMHVWGWSSVLYVGRFVSAGPQGLGGAVLGPCWLWWDTSVGGEQPDTLPWLQQLVSRRAFLQEWAHLRG